MYFDFTHPIQAPEPYYGWLEKKGSLRKNWKLRYFFLAEGLLKYYGKGPTSPGTEGSDMKGDVSLLGAEVSIFEGTQIHVTLHGEKKSIFYLRAKTNKEASEWHGAIVKQIQFDNILALQNGSRSPEIVEWYYQYQSEVFQRNNFLQKSIEVYIHFNPNDLNPIISIFNITMNPEKSGLLLRIVSSGRKTHRSESINNGRIILFSDIVGMNLTMGWNLTAENRFIFTIITSEDELTMEADPMGVTWLQGVQEMVQLTRIPKPSARSVSISPAGRAMSANMNSLIEFSSNSGAVFTCSNDVQLILDGFNRVTSKSPVVSEVGFRLSSILKLIPDLKYNKETGFILGERIEEVIRILGDTENGVLYVSRESDKALINFHLSTLNNKLNDIIQYLISQCKEGWLTMSLNGKAQDSMKQKFEQFDFELVTIINICIKALGLNPALLMDKKEYTMAVDVKKSIEALGGIEAIYHDVAKERALARLIQAEGYEIHNEVVSFIKNFQNGSDGSRRSSQDKGRFKVSIESEQKQSSSKRSCWSYFTCCLRGNRHRDEDLGSQQYQLYDDKNVITINNTTNPVHYNSRRNSRSSRVNRGSELAITPRSTESSKF